MDALQAQRAHAAYLVDQHGAHYLLTVKNNQPTLACRLQRLPWKDAPVLDRSTTRGDGREEVREVQVVSVNGLLFPHAKQVVRIRRRRRRFGAKKWTSETVFAVTDLAARQAGAREIATWARGHWTIENSVHWIKDVTFGEDASRVRTRNTPTVMAALRDIVRGALRLTGLRQHRQRTTRPHRTSRRPDAPRHPMIKSDIPQLLWALSRPGHDAGVDSAYPGEGTPPGCERDDGRTSPCQTADLDSPG